MLVAFVVDIAITFLLLFLRILSDQVLVLFGLLQLPRLPIPLQLPAVLVVGTIVKELAGI